MGCPLYTANYASLINGIGFWCLSSPQIGTQSRGLYSICARPIQVACMGCRKGTVAPEHRGKPLYGPSDGPQAILSVPPDASRHQKELGFAIMAA